MKQTYRSNFALVLVSLGASLAIPACSDDEPSTDDAPTVTGGNGGNAGTGKGGSSGSSGKGGKGGSGGTSGSSSNEGGTGDVGNEGGSGGTGNAGNEGGTGNTGSDCVEDPQTNDEFLNRCTDSKCSPFDNAARIPGFTGELPPL